MKINSIQAKIGTILLALFLLVAVSVTATVWAVDDQEQDALVINLAGRQRMISQRVIWLALAAPDSAELTASIQRFDQTLSALRHGGAALDAPTPRR